MVLCPSRLKLLCGLDPDLACPPVCPLFPLSTDFHRNPQHWPGAWGPSSPPANITPNHVYLQSGPGVRARPLAANHIPPAGLAHGRPGPQPAAHPVDLPRAAPTAPLRASACVLAPGVWRGDESPVLCTGAERGSHPFSPRESKVGNSSKQQVLSVTWGPFPGVCTRWVLAPLPANAL